jgi:hypothetical protein
MPVTRFTERSLAATVAGDALPTALADSWSARNRDAMHCQCPALKARKTSRGQKLCALAGFCLHGRGNRLAAFEAALVKQMQSRFPAKSFDRRLLKLGFLFLHITCEQQSFAAHVSDSKLGSGDWRFSMLPLTAVSVDDAGIYHLKATATTTWKLSWEVFREGFDFSKPHYLSILVLRARDKNVPGPFEPSVVEAEVFGASRMFWPGARQPPPRAVAPLGDGPRPEADDGAASGDADPSFDDAFFADRPDSDMDILDDIAVVRGARPARRGGNDVDDVEENAEEDDDVEGDCGGLKSLIDQMEAIRVIEEEDEEIVGKNRPTRAGNGAASGSGSAVIVPAEPSSGAASSSGSAVPAPPMALPALPGPRAAPRRRHVPDDDPTDRTEWPKVYHTASGGYLRLSLTKGETFYDIRAVCNVHKGCTVTKRCRPGDPVKNPARGRPIGLEWQFLRVSSQYATKEEHRDSISEWGGQPDRLSARSEFALRPGAAEFLSKERLLRVGEGPEPLGIA